MSGRPTVGDPVCNSKTTSAVKSLSSPVDLGVLPDKGVLNTRDGSSEVNSTPVPSDFQILKPFKTSL